MESSQDPRDRLVREKYFTLRPKPLERWLWQQGLPPAAERVFWLHWEEGMRNRSWCSEIPLRRVAADCCLDPSTVTRAYQALKGLGLIRREDPGRDPANPFQQATAITEVRIPRELLTELGRFPSRHWAPTAANERAAQKPEGRAVQQANDRAEQGAAPAAPEGPTVEPPRRFSREAIHSMLARLSVAERSAYFTASRNQRGDMAFDANSKLTPEEQAFLRSQLRVPAGARNSPTLKTNSVQKPAGTLSRRLTPLEIARARRAIQTHVTSAREAAEALRQVVWSVEEGALRAFGPLKGLNIALKKIREGAWTRPNRMPPNWQRVCTVPEICVAA
jgi:hypothetical protein